MLEGLITAGEVPWPKPPAARAHVSGFSRTRLQRQNTLAVWEFVWTALPIASGEANNELSNVLQLYR
jgi:hypothetical protein